MESNLVHSISSIFVLWNQISIHLLIWLSDLLRSLTQLNMSCGIYSVIILWSSIVLSKISSSLIPLMILIINDSSR